jgi:hypothetical protein
MLHPKRKNLYPGEITKPGDNLHPPLTEEEKANLLPKEKKIEPIKETVHSDKLYDLMVESSKRQEEILKAIQSMKGTKESEPKPNEKSPEQLAMEKKLLEDEKK